MGQAPVRVGGGKRRDQEPLGEPRLQEHESEPEPARAPPPPPEDIAREKLNGALVASQPERALPELTDEDKARNFANAVRARSSSPAQKDGAPSPSRTYPATREVKHRDGAFRTWDLIVEVGTQPDDLLNPYYFQHIARKFTTWDQLCIRWEDGSMYAEAIVCETSQLYTRIEYKAGFPMALAVCDPDVDSLIPPGHDIKWRGEAHKFAVLRGNVVVRDGFPNKMDAVVYARNLARAVTR